MSIRNIDDQKNELLKKIESITTSDTISQFMEKCNNNFSEIAKYGGGPAGKTGEQGSQGNPTKPKVPIHVWKKGEEYSDEKEINSTKTYEIIDINEDLYNSKYQEGHLIMLENAHAYILKNYDQQLKPEFVAAISSLNTKDLEEALAGIYGYVHIAYAKDVDKNGAGWNGFITDQQLSNNKPNEDVIIEGNIDQEFKEKDDKYDIFYLSDYKYMGIYSDNQKISVSNPEKYTWFNIQKDNFEASLSNSVTTVLVNHNYECIESTTLTTSVNFYKNSEIISNFNVNIELDEKDPNFNKFTIVDNEVSCDNIVFSKGDDVKVPIKITYTNPIDESKIVTKIYWTLSPIKILEDVKIFIDKNVVNISNHTLHTFKIGYYIFTNGQTKFVDSPINNLKGYKWYFINDYDNGLDKIIENIKSYPSLNVDSWSEITHDFAPNSNINSNIYKYCYVLLCDENYKLIDCDVITTVDNGNDIHLELSKPYIVLPANIEGNGVHGSYDDDINPITTKITLYDNGDIISNNIEYEFYNHYIEIDELNQYNVIDELISGTDDNGKENISVDKDGVITISKDYLNGVGIQNGHKEIKCVVKYNHTDRNNGDSDIEYNATFEKILSIDLKETPYKLEFDKNKLKRDKDNNYNIIGDTLNCNVKCYINGSWQNDNEHNVKATWVDKNVDFYFGEDSDSDIDYGYTLDLSNLNKNNNYKDINYIVISYYNDKETYLTETICILDDGDKGNDIYLELSKPYIVLPANIDGNGVHEYYDEEKYPITSKITLYDNGDIISDNNDSDSDSNIVYNFYNENNVIIDGDEYNYGRINVKDGVITISKDYLNEVGIQNGHKEIKCKAIYTYHDNDTSTDKEVKIEKILTIELKETPYKLEFDKNTLKRKINKVNEYVYDLEIIGNTLNCNVKCYINGLWKNDNTFSVKATCMDDDSDDNNNYSYTFVKNSDSDSNSDYDYTLNLNNLNEDYGDSELSDIDNIVISCYKGDTTYLTETIWILDDGPEGKRGVSGEKGDDIYLDLSIPYIILPANLEGTGVHESYKKDITSKIILYKNGGSFKEDEYEYKFFDEDYDEKNNPINDDDNISVNEDGVITISKDYLNEVGIQNGHKEIRCVVNVENIYTDIDGVIPYEKILTIGLNETPYKLELSAYYDTDTPKIGNTIKYSEKLSKLHCKIKTYINGVWEEVKNNSYTIQFTINDGDEDIRFEYDDYESAYVLDIKENNLLELLSNINKFNLDLISKNKVLLSEEICLLYDADYTCLELSKQHITLPTNIDGTGIHELYIDNKADTNIPLLTFKIYDSINYDLPNNYKIECFYEGIEPSIKLTDSNDNDNYLSCNPSGKDINVTTTKSKFNKLLNNLLNDKNFNIKDIFEIKIVATLLTDETKTYKSYFYIEFKETPYKLEFNQNILRRDNEDEDYIVRENPLNCNVKCYINGSWQNDNTYSVKATWNNHFYNFYKNDDSDRDYDYTLDLSEDEISKNLNGDDNKDIDNIVISCYDGEKTYLTEKILILDPGIQGIQGIPGPNMYLDVSKSHFILPANIDGNGVHEYYNEEKYPITTKITLYQNGTPINTSTKDYKSSYEFYDGNSDITEGIDVTNGEIIIPKAYLTSVHKEIKCVAKYTYNDVETSEVKEANFEKILTFELKETPYKLEFDKNTLKRDKYNENKVIGDTLKCNVICYIDGAWVNDNSTFSVSVISSLANDGNPDFVKNSDSDYHSDSDYDYTLNLSELEFNGVDNIVISCYKGDTTYLTETIWILDDGKYGKSISLDLSKSHFILPANIDGNGIHDEYKEPITSKITLYDDCTPIADGVEYEFYEYNTENSDLEWDQMTSGVSVENGVITIEKNYLNNNSNSKFENGHKEIKCVVKYTYNNDTSEDKEITFEKILTFELKETPYKLEFDKNTLKRKLIESDESDEFDDSNKYVIIDGELNCNVKCYINGEWVNDNKYDIIVPSDDISDDDIKIEKNETGYTLNLSKLGGDNYKDLDNIVISYHNNNTNTTYLTETICILDDGEKGADGKDGHSIYLELSKSHFILPANLDGTGIHYAYNKDITSKVILYDNGTPIKEGVTYKFYDYSYESEINNITVDDKNGIITITKEYLNGVVIFNGHKEIKCVAYYTYNDGTPKGKEVTLEKILTIELKETPFKLELDKPILKRGKNGLSNVQLNCNIKYYNYMNGKWEVYNLNSSRFEVFTSETGLNISHSNYDGNTWYIVFGSIGDNIDNIEIRYYEKNVLFLTETVLILNDGVDGEKGDKGDNIYLELSRPYITLPSNITGNGVLEPYINDINEDNSNSITSELTLYNSGTPIKSNVEYVFHKDNNIWNNTYIAHENGVLTITKEGLKQITGNTEIKCTAIYDKIKRFEKILFIELKETPFRLKLDKTTVKPVLVDEELNCHIEYFMNGQWNKFYDENYTEIYEGNFELYLNDKKYEGDKTSVSEGVFIVPFSIINDNDINTESITIKYFKDSESESPLFEETIFTIKDGQNDDANIYLNIHNNHILLPANIDGTGVLNGTNRNKIISIDLSLFGQNPNSSIDYNNVKYNFYIITKNNSKIPLTLNGKNLFLPSFTNPCLLFNKPSEQTNGIGSLKVENILYSLFNQPDLNKEGRITICCELIYNDDFINFNSISFGLKETPFKLEFNKNILKISELNNFTLTCKIQYNYNNKWENYGNTTCSLDLSYIDKNNNVKIIDNFTKSNVDNIYYHFNFDNMNNINIDEIDKFKVTLYNDSTKILSENIEIFDDRSIYRYKFNAKFEGDINDCKHNSTLPESIDITYCDNPIIKFSNLVYDEEYIKYINSEFIDINNLNYINNVHEMTYIGGDFYYTQSSFKGKFKIVENKDINDPCDYIIYFRATPKFNISISGIDTYYDNNIKIYYDGIEYKNGDIIKTFDLDCHKKNYLKTNFDSNFDSDSDSDFDSINNYYNIKYEDTISTQYGLFKCEKIIKQDTNIYYDYIIDLTYKKAYTLNIIKDSDIYNPDNVLCFIINDELYNYNDIIIIDNDKINEVISTAQIKYRTYAGNLESLPYDYIFYIENSTINVEIKNTKNNYKTFKFNSITGVPVNNINLYVYGHSLKLNDSIKLFCDGGYIPICNLTATHKNNRIYHFVYNYDITTDIVNIDLVYNKITELPIFETNIDDFVGTYEILCNNNSEELYIKKCKCDISINNSDYDNTFNAKFYAYEPSNPNIQYNPGLNEIIEFTYDGEYITSQNDNNIMNIILSNSKLCKINTIYENGFKDNTMILYDRELIITEITKIDIDDSNFEEIEDDIINNPTLT